MRSDVSVADSELHLPDPDHAWKALTLVNDWIKHADTKVAATLAGTAATALALYNLLNNEADRGCVFAAASVGCGALLLWTARCSLKALVPRRTILKKRAPVKLDNLLFYGHIARAYPPEKKSAYTHALGELTMSDHELTKHIAEQVHANANVANQKYDWVNKAINALALAVGFLAVAALAAVWK